MDVSKNRGVPPKSSIFNRDFHDKPSILGYPYFWKHPETNIAPENISQEKEIPIGNHHF